MAELNVFKTVAETIAITNDSIYAAPINYTGIVLSLRWQT